jgi:hypothetical protein
MFVYGQNLKRNKKPNSLVKSYLTSTFCFLLLITINSCQKDNDQPIFILGDTSAMKADILDTVINTDPLNQHLIFDVDIDEDNIADFRFLSSRIQNSGYDNKLELICLNSQSFVKSNTITDTSFIRTYSSTITNSNGLTETTVYIDNVYYRSIDNVSYWETQKLTYVVPLMRGEQLKNNQWQSDTFVMKKKFFTQTIEELGPGWIKHTYYYYDFHNIFPEHQIRYIGIKKIVRGTEKLGWIKLMIVHETNMLVQEVAIQK